MEKVTVKIARIMAGLTQQQCADWLNMNINTYGSLEKNPEKFTMKQAQEFAKLVKRDLHDIVFLNENSI